MKYDLSRGKKMKQMAAFLLVLGLALTSVPTSWQFALAEATELEKVIVYGDPPGSYVESTANILPKMGTVKIGIVRPHCSTPGDGIWEGAKLAKDIINEHGGMLGPGGWYEVVLVDINEHSSPWPDPAAAVRELLMKLDANPDMYLIIGGFKSECVFPMQEVLLDYAAVYGRPVWFITGEAADELITPIQTNYARYKYMFRASPMNSTISAHQLGAMIGNLIAPKLAALYYRNPTQLVPAYIIAENLVWCDVMVTTMQTMGVYFGLDVKGVRRPSALATDFSADIAAAVAAGAKIVVHIFSTMAGRYFIKQYGALKPPFTLVGINIESMERDFWETTGRLCEYETILASVVTREDVYPYNPYAKPLTSREFWFEYERRYRRYPTFVAWGTYDAIMALNETFYDPGIGTGWMVLLDVANGYANPDMDAFIEFTETLGASHGFDENSRPDIRIQLADGCVYRSTSLTGYFRFSGMHDVYASACCLSPVHDGVVRAFMVQWQAGRMEVVWPRDQLYSRKWMIPSWMYSLETDFAGHISINTGIPTDGGWWNYTAPNGWVDPCELAALAEAWFSVPHWTLLEADMQPYDHFIDLYDAVRVEKDWGKSEVPK